MEALGMRFLSFEDFFVSITWYVQGKLLDMIESRSNVQALETTTIANFASSGVAIAEETDFMLEALAISCYESLIDGPTFVMKQVESSTMCC